jgi:ATP-dependent DNA helicase HFM1/MER3
MMMMIINDFRIPAVLAQYSKRKPVMIFCATKRAAATQASKLAELWTATAPPKRLWKGPRQQLNVINE